MAATYLLSRENPTWPRDPAARSTPIRRSSFQVWASQTMIPDKLPAAMNRPSGENRYSATHPMPESMTVFSPVAIFTAWKTPPGPLATTCFPLASNSTEGIEPPSPRVNVCATFPVEISITFTVPSELPPVASILPSGLTASAQV
jgi:hypothetical protein